jgi:hypothetical protein
MVDAMFPETRIASISRGDLMGMRWRRMKKESIDGLKTETE